jgi:hypothetical protein
VPPREVAAAPPVAAVPTAKIIAMSSTLPPTDPTGSSRHDSDDEVDDPREVRKMHVLAGALGLLTVAIILGASYLVVTLVAELIS